MTSAEYQQLVEFLGRQFTEIDRRFGEADRRFTELRQDMLGHFKDGTVLYARDEDALYAVAIRTPRSWEGFRHIHRQYLDEVLRG